MAVVVYLTCKFRLKILFVFLFVFVVVQLRNLIEVVEFVVALVVVFK